MTFYSYLQLDWHIKVIQVFVSNVFPLSSFWIRYINLYMSEFKSFILLTLSYFIPFLSPLCVTKSTGHISERIKASVRNETYCRSCDIRSKYYST